jgi:hypothetical protein
MAVFFVLAPVDQEAPQTFTATYAGAPYIVPYWVTFLVAVNLLLGDMVRLVARYANLSPKEHLRLGLHLITVGGSFAVAYWCYWSAYLVLRLAERPVPSGLSTAGRICMFAALAFCVLGSTVPALGPRVGLPTPYAWLASLSDYRQLYPLWRALATAVPEIVLNQPPRITLDVRFWLNRRIIEIEDGLRLYGRSPALATAYSDPASEAELIRQALTAGRPQATAAVSINEAAQEPESSYADRLRWHLDVARAYANSGRGGIRALAVPDAPLRKEVDSAT